MIQAISVLGERPLPAHSFPLELSNSSVPLLVHYLQDFVPQEHSRVAWFVSELSRALPRLALNEGWRGLFLFLLLEVFLALGRELLWRFFDVVIVQFFNHLLPPSPFLDEFKNWSHVVCLFPLILFFPNLLCNDLPDVFHLIVAVLGCEVSSEAPDVSFCLLFLLIAAAQELIACIVLLLEIWEVELLLSQYLSCILVLNPLQ